MVLHDLSPYLAADASDYSKKDSAYWHSYSGLPLPVLYYRTST